MAKIKHNKIIDTIDEIISDAEKKGMVHLYSEDEFFTGRKIQVNGRELFHFGTTGYLGLEQDPRLKAAAIEAIQKFGTQFPLSKTYLSYNIYRELEESLMQMYQKNVLISKNSTLGHMAVIPTVVREEDAVILDQQVHNSVQSAVQFLKPRGIHVEIIRHNNMEILEDRIKALNDKYDKIWYLVDGVYSMFGDCTPIHSLINLLNTYPKFHLYVDDVHGMSWAGEHGTGFIMSQIKTLHEKMILMGTLSKSFGASGGLIVFPNETLYRKVKTFGGPQTFSAQLEPASVAAALASAKIHLSPEIYEFQKELREKIDFCNSLIKNSDLPLIEENNCPVFFIGTGLPAIGYNFVNRLMNEGFYVNFATFPVVPVKNTGVRFTISRHNKMEDIAQLVDAMKYHFPKALEEEKYSLNHVRKAFRLPILEDKIEPIIEVNKQFKIQHETSISQISKSDWNRLFDGKGIFDWDGLQFMEETFSGNEDEKDNWKFHYFVIRNEAGEIVLATFFTLTYWKEDMLAEEEVSKRIEEVRKDDPDYLISKVLAMGSIFSEGDHLYINRTLSNWRDIFAILLEYVSQLARESETSSIVLRDFDQQDDEVKEFLINQGYVKIALPDSNVGTNLSWNNNEEFLETLSKRSRRHIKYDVLKYEHFFDIEVKDSVSEEEGDYLYKLFLNVHANNMALNMFPYPKKMIQSMNSHKNWEYVIIKLKSEYDSRTEKLPIGVIFGYKGVDTYTPQVVGIDYSFMENFKIYKQSLFQMIRRARQLNKKKIYWGLSASIEKKKFGAEICAKMAFIQMEDNYNLEVIGLVNANKTE